VTVAASKTAIRASIPRGCHVGDAEVVEARRSAKQRYWKVSHAHSRPGLQVSDNPHTSHDSWSSLLISALRAERCFGVRNSFPQFGQGGS
jgi:hypothetical protein